MSLNIKKNVGAVSADLEKLDTKDALLSIGLSTKGFSLSIMNKAVNELLLLADYTVNFGDSFNDNLFAIRPIFEEHKLTTKFFPNKQIVFRNSRFALLPESIYDKSQIAACLQVLHGEPENKVEEFTDSLPQFSAYTVYDIPVSLLQATRIIFPTATYKHHASALLNYAVRFAEAENTTAVIEVGENDFYLTIFDNRKLVFCNAFTYLTKEDFIYFVLSVFNQLKIDVHTANVLLTGKITEDSQLFSILYKYINKVSLIQKPVCKSSMDVSVNQYATLLQCE